APKISPVSGIFGTGQTVTITGEPGATIHYTTDGSTPTSSSPTYTTSFNVTSTTTVKAIDVFSFGTSGVASNLIQIDSSAVNLPVTGLTTWLRGDFGVNTSGSNVTSWTDASGNGYVFAQSTGTAQPTFVSSAINSLPALSFNGTSQFLQAGAGY